MTSQVIDVDAGNFNQEVIEASRQLPVLIDFWAPWCAPCKALGPMLEKLAQDYNGKFRLVKINSDESIELARQFGVRSIPDVRAIRNGKQVAQFVGALPMPQLRAFVDNLIPSDSETARMRAAELMQAGDASGAALALSEALSLDAKNDLARLELAELMIEQDQLEEGEKLLDAMRPNIDLDGRSETLRASITFRRSVASGPDDDELKSRIATHPADLAARLTLAERYAAKRAYRTAMDALLEIIRLDRNWREGAARKQMLAIFSLAEGEPELVSEYRKRLASALH